MKVVRIQKVQWVLDQGFISVGQTAERWSATKQYQSTRASNLRLKPHFEIERMIRKLARLKPDMQLTISKVEENTPIHSKIYWDLRANWRSLRSNPIQIHRQARGPHFPLKPWGRLIKQILQAEQLPIKTGQIAFPATVIAPQMPDNLKKLQSLESCGEWQKIETLKWPIFNFESEIKENSATYWAIHWNREFVLARNVKKGGLYWLEMGACLDRFESLKACSPNDQTFANQNIYQMPIMMGDSL